MPLSVRAHSVHLRDPGSVCSQSSSGTSRGLPDSINGPSSPVLQIHILESGEVRVFSRNQEDNTSKYPDIISRIPKVSERRRDEAP